MQQILYNKLVQNNIPLQVSILLTSFYIVLQWVPSAMK